MDENIWLYGYKIKRLIVNGHACRQGFPTVGEECISLDRRDLAVDRIDSQSIVRR